MIIQQIDVNQQTKNFSYIAGCEDTKQGVVVDPAFSPDRILNQLEETGLQISYILNTHGHHDHTNANQDIQQATGAEVLMPSGEIGPTPDRSLDDREMISVGDLRIKVLMTPGHTPRSCCFYVRDERVLFSGDTLFVGKVGGTEPRGKTARQQYESLHNCLAHLPEETVVYPGHDYGPRPRSTIGWEKQHNPFLQQTSFLEFCDLKKNWASRKEKWENYLQEHA